MTSVYIRVLVKLFTFFFMSLFIMLFVVNGYRYDPKVGVVQKNLSMEGQFWSDTSSFKLNGNDYFSVDKYINLYNQHEGCYDIEYKGDSYTKCLDNDQYYKDIFINLDSLEKINKLPICNSVDYVSFEGRCLGSSCFSEEIQNAFTFKKNNFISLNNNQLFYCDIRFENCKLLGKITGEIVCGNKDGLFSFDGTNYYALWLK